MSNDDRQQLLRDAAEEGLVPLARLCVSQGLPVSQAEELFKRAYVRAARDARQHAGSATTRDVSQVSVATGVNRREVTRITAELAPRAVQRPSPATQLFSRWISDKKLRGRNGKLKPLRHYFLGDAAEAEAKAKAVAEQARARG